MIQIYFHQNENKLQAIASGFVVISQLNLELHLNRENWVQFLRKAFSCSIRRDSYGTILANLCRAVRVEAVQNLELFSDRVPVQFLRSKNSEFRSIIRSYLESNR